MEQRLGPIGYKSCCFSKINKMVFFFFLVKYKMVFDDAKCIHMLYPHSNYDLLKINKSLFSKKKIYVSMIH